MKIDLNVQSKWSTGDMTPLDLVLKATASGITHMALCDYGSTQALNSLKDIAYIYGIKIINGISFHTYDTISRQIVTLRGFAFDEPNVDIQALCAPGALLETEDVVRAIVLARGKVVLANPHEINPSGLIERLIQIGLCGIERLYPRVMQYDLSAVDSLIERYGLMVTGGSYDESHQWDGLLSGQYLCPNDTLPRLMNYRRVSVG